MKKIMKIFLIAAIAITIVIIGLNLLLNKKNTSKISSNVYKPTQIEDWRINDINTYEYIFSEIISQFNDGYLDDRLWITDNFRKNYNIDDYGIYLSRVGAPDEEWYREDDSTGEITAFSDNTQDLLDKGKIIFYTRKRENGKLSSENKYTFSFEIDKDGKLDKLTVQDKIKIKDYTDELARYSELFYTLLIDANIFFNDVSNENISYFIDGVSSDIVLKKLFINKNLKCLEFKERLNISTRGRLVYDVKVEENGEISFYGFSIKYVLNDKNLISDFYIDYSSSWGKISENTYNDMPIIADEDDENSFE